MLKIGDVVNILFEDAKIDEREVTVRYVPTASEDLWGFMRRDGTFIYVNQFAKMVKVG